jgi:phage-related protein (TIGR01555 family)
MTKAASSNPLTLIRDGLKNILSGRGTSVDKAAHDFWHHLPMEPSQIEAAYRASWLIRKIVDLPIEDMTREWRAWSLETEEIARIEEAERNLNVVEEILKGLRYGRLGGGVVIIGTDARDYSVAPRAGEKLLYLKALPKAVIGLDEFQWDLSSEFFGKPRNFILSGQGARDVIHPARVIVFHGEPVPSLLGDIGEEGFWGCSVVEVVNQAVKDFDKATGGFASLIDEAKIDIFKLAGLADTLLQPEGDTKVKNRVETTNMAKSLWRAIFLDGEDDWQQKQITWTGMPDLIRTYMNVAAGAADIPATRLYGKAPDGQNSTGESDDRNYRSMISTKQTRILRPALLRLDRFLLPAVNVEPASTWLFSPLSTPTEAERADIEKKRAETVKIYNDTGLIPNEAFGRAVQSRLVEDDTYPSLGEELKKIPDSELVPDPSEGVDDPSRLATPEGRAMQAAGIRPAGRPAPRAVNDAAPRSLYVSRAVLNAQEVIDWARSQGFDSTLDAADLHVTIMHSRKELDWMDVETNWGSDDDGGLRIKPGGARLVEPLGDEGAVVLLFNSSELSWRHEQLKQAGAQHSFDEYQPHVTITYRKPAGLDLKTVEPYVGALDLGPEIFQEIRESWEPPAA